MTTNISDVHYEQRPSAPELSVLAEQLVAAARTQGVELTGPGGLLTGLTKHDLQRPIQGCNRPVGPPGSGSGLGNRTGSNAGTAPQADSTNTWPRDRGRFGVRACRSDVPLIAETDSMRRRLAPPLAEHQTAVSGIGGSTSLAAWAAVGFLEVQLVAALCHRAAWRSATSRRSSGTMWV
jgi:hypothetical protein